MQTQPRHAQNDALRVRYSEWVIAAAVGAILTGFVWRDLISGGGLVGGDTYTYFFPQKAVVAEAFESGVLPLWHDRTALGYPLHAESQAGVFYPFTQVMYRLFDINTAYSLTIVVHYLLAFVLTWRFLRCQQISCLSALFGATIFVYGWFPARISLEWSIIGGVWFPLALWMTDRVLRSGTASSICVLAGCLALHLLAGHFALAFISQLSCIAYAMLRVFAERDADARQIGKAVVQVGSAIGLAVLLAAIQLVPTYELKTISLRSGAEAAFDPAYGHLPPVYVTQLLASWWYWHTPEIIASHQMMTVLPWSHVSAATNPVECHFYLGLLPLCLVLAAMRPAIRRRLPHGIAAVWTVLGIAALVYATGWFVPITRHLPGFGWFMGPGRYTITAQMAGAVLASAVLDGILRRRRIVVRTLVTASVLLLTLADVEKSSQPPVRDAVVVEDPPLNELAQSWVAAELNQSHAADVRLLIRGPNVGNLYGVSCLPSYLGLGPAVYVEEQQKYSAFPQDPDAVFPNDNQHQLLDDRGVTHVLTTEEIPNPSPRLKLVRAAPDSFLNRVWARGAAFCWLYQFEPTPERVTSDPPAALTSWQWLQRKPGRVSFEVTLAEPAVVRLSELMMPGWTVSVDGEEASATGDDQQSRDVLLQAGTRIVQWSYMPFSFVIGLTISSVSLLAVTVILVVSSRHSSRTR